MKSTKKLILSLSAVLVLTACGGAESPNDVIDNFKQELTDIETYDGRMTMSFDGQDAVDVMNLQFDVDFQVDRANLIDQKMNIDFDLDASLESADGLTEGALGMSMMLAESNLLFKLNELNFNDPALEAYQPIISSYQNKWLKLSGDFVPDTLARLSEERTPEVVELEEKAQELFVEADLFDVVKEYGNEEVGGNDTYHYEVTLNEAGVKKYVDELAKLDPEAVTPLEEGELDEFIKSIENIDLWIGVNDYFLYKAVVNVKADGPELEGATFDFSMTYLANAYNEPVNVNVPTDFEEFDPLSVMLGLSAAGALDSTAEVPAE